MAETAYFFQRGGERLFAFLHRPAAACRGGIVLCAPLAEEKLWAHRVFVSFARELAAEGYAVLRFDCRGEGDSDRAFEESSLTTRVEDTAAAIEELARHQPGDTGLTLVGLRLGANVAALAARGRRDVRRLVLWEPVLDGPAYLQSVLRSNLMYQMARHRRVVENREALVERIRRGELVNVEGYGLGGELYREVAALKLADCPPSTGVSTLVVSIAAQDAPPRDDLAALRREWEGTTVVSAAEEPFWREIRRFYRRAANLFGATFEWMRATA
jgi:uncharacterized protein